MPRKSDTRKKVFCSISEVKKEFYPNSFKKKIRKEKEEEPGLLGSELAIDLLRRLKQI